MSYQNLINQLWQQYAGLITHAKAVHALLEAKGEVVVNDHIAFRTINDPRVNIDVLAAPWESIGYQRCGQYEFKEKKLFARHFEHPDDQAPKIFISELMTECFSQSLQSILKDCLHPVDVPKPRDLLTAGVLWGPLSFATYQALLSESQYAAWWYAFGYRANHFTVSVNALKHYSTIEAVNVLLKANGYCLNDQGGEIKGKPSDLLQQSSTMAEEVAVTFGDEQRQIPACYYEFAHRFRDERGQLFQGFVPQSADKIFQSTDNSEQ